MSKARFPLSLCLAAVLVAAPAERRVQAAPAVAAPSPDLATERLRLRGQLDRVNAEIDALKRAGGPEARLRARLADAEALARRLVDLERRMGLTAPPSEPRPLPTASPSDGPADLEAKADILVDQARRVRAAADALDRRVTELKGRQELRRRAADLDRDPFAPLEGSKRRIVRAADRHQRARCHPFGRRRRAGQHAQHLQRQRGGDPAGPLRRAARAAGPGHPGGCGAHGTRPRPCIGGGPAAGRGRPARAGRQPRRPGPVHATGRRQTVMSGWADSTSTLPPGCEAEPPWWCRGCCWQRRRARRTRRRPTTSASRSARKPAWNTTPMPTAAS